MPPAPKPWRASSAARAMGSPAPTSPTAPQCARSWRGSGRTRSSILRPRPCRPLDRRPFRLHFAPTSSHLHAARRRPRLLADARRRAAARFRFHHVSTDEVFGSLGPTGRFTETDGLRSEFALFGLEGGLRHLVRACTGPTGCQSCSATARTITALSVSREAHPADDPPRSRRRAIAGLWQRLQRARLAPCRRPRRRPARGADPRRSAESYNIGGNSERTNLAVVEAVCSLLDELAPRSPHLPHAGLISYVTDRPGHDQRYAIDATKLASELDWSPKESFESGLRKTSSGTSRIAAGGTACSRRATTAAGSALRRPRLSLRRATSHASRGFRQLRAGRQRADADGPAARLAAPRLRPQPVDVTDAAAVAVCSSAAARHRRQRRRLHRVDRAESERERAFAVNETAPGVLAAACARSGTALIHYSTDYVSTAASRRPMSRMTAVAPLGVYGASKEAGERTIRAALPRHVILRTSWVYGVDGANFVKTMIRLAGERPSCRVVADQIGCPTAAAISPRRRSPVAARIAAGAPEWAPSTMPGSAPPAGMARRRDRRMRVALDRPPPRDPPDHDRRLPDAGEAAGQLGARLHPDRQGAGRRRQALAAQPRPHHRCIVQRRGAATEGIMKGIILAGGSGSRLFPLTQSSASSCSRSTTSR